MPYVDRDDAWVLFDNRGGGRTGMPSGPVSIPAMAADVAAVLDAAGAAPVHVVGHSVGGLIAQELAVRHRGPNSASCDPVRPTRARLPRCTSAEKRDLR